ncbi:zinc-ribbon domain-containing protein, partial [Flavobacteriaceae bacterium]|nr:zinc-ribbon domain-containing protein [Flavobacteriaceae bacterium]
MPNKPSLAETHPELVKQWHTKRNGDLRPTDVTRGSRKKVWWICEFHAGYEWEAVIDKRTYRGQGCPLCATENRRPRTPPLSQTHPELVGEWHPTKNGLLNPSKPIVASKKVWWICP